MRDDSPGRLGVFLRYDPDDFGLSAPPEAKGADGGRNCLTSSLLLVVSGDGG